MELFSQTRQLSKADINTGDDIVAMERHLLSLNNAAATSAVLDAAIDLAMVDKFRDGPRSAEQIAAAAGWSAEGTSRLLRVLCQLNLITHIDGRRYDMPQCVIELLSPTSAGSIAGHLKAVYSCRDSWRSLAETVQSGLRENHLGTLAQRAEHAEFFMRGGQQLLDEARRVASLSEPCVDTAVVLYSSGGEWALAQAEAGNARTIYAVDHPAFLARAKSFVEPHPVARHIEFVESASEVQSYPKCAQIVVVPPLLRFLAEAQASEVVAAAISNLAPEGELFIVDILKYPGESPAVVPMLDLSLLVNTSAGGIRALDYYQQLIEVGNGRLTEVHRVGMLTTLRARRRIS